MKETNIRNAIVCLLCVLIFFIMNTEAIANVFSSSIYKSQAQNVIVDNYNHQIEEKIKSLNQKLKRAKLKIGTDPEGCTSLECQLKGTQTQLHKLIDAQGALIELNRANAKSLSYLLGLKDSEINGLVFGNKGRKAGWLARLYGAENKGGVLYQEAVISAQASARVISSAFNLDLAGVIKQSGLMSEGITGGAESVAAKVLKGITKTKLAGKNIDPKKMFKDMLRKTITGGISKGLSKQFYKGLTTEEDRSIVSNALHKTSSKITSQIVDIVAKNALADAEKVLIASGKTFKTASIKEIKTALSTGIKSGFKVKLKPEQITGIVGQAVLAIGNVVADASQKAEQKRLTALTKQLGESKTQRLELIHAWRKTMGLHKAMKKAKADQIQLLQGFLVFSKACKETNEKVKSCLPAIQSKTATYQSQRDGKIKPFTAALNKAKADYDIAASNLKRQKTKWQTLMDKSKALHLQWKAEPDIEKRIKINAANKRILEKLKYLDWTVESSREGLARDKLVRAQVRRTHAIESAALEMSFIREDTQKELLACLNKGGTPSVTPIGNVSSKRVNHADFDLAAAYSAIFTIQKNILSAIDQATIETKGGEQCKQPAKEKPVTEKTDSKPSRSKSESRSVDCSSITGEWETNWGNMTLQLKRGGKVTGHYGESQLIMQSHGNKVKGTWVQHNSSVRCKVSKYGSYYWGAAEFNFNTAMNKFSGPWNYCDGGFAGEWTGSRDCSKKGGKDKLKDRHVGWSGATQRNNVYHLEIENYSKDRNYILHGEWLMGACPGDIGFLNKKFGWGLGRETNAEVVLFHGGKSHVIQHLNFMNSKCLSFKKHPTFPNDGISPEIIEVINKEAIPRFSKDISKLITDNGKYSVEVKHKSGCCGVFTREISLVGEPQKEGSPSAFKASQ